MTPHSRTVMSGQQWTPIHAVCFGNCHRANGTTCLSRSELLHSLTSMPSDDSRDNPFWGILTQGREIWVVHRYWAKPRLWLERDQRRCTLYYQGLTDRLIAEVEGIDRASVGQWRRARSLPPNDSPTIRFAYANAAKQALMRERLKLIDLHWTDATIAFHQHRSRRTIGCFRRVHGLPPATGTLDDKPMTISYEAAYGELHIADARWSNWLEEMGATVW